MTSSNYHKWQDLTSLQPSAGLAYGQQSHGSKIVHFRKTPARTIDKGCIASNFCLWGQKHTTCVSSRIKHAIEVMRNKCSAVVEMGDRFATIDMGCKTGDCVPLLAKLDLHLTQCGSWAEAYTFVLGGILIHPAVWPQ